MSLLRAAAALVLVCGGWCAGEAWQTRLAAHEAAVRDTLALLQRVRQEIAYRREDLYALAEQLRCEGLLPPQSASLQTLAPPLALTRQEAACFAECFAGLGRSAAQAECERLELYICRFEAFLAAAAQRSRAGAALSRRLGLAAGAVLALLVL